MHKLIWSALIDCRLPKVIKTINVTEKYVASLKEVIASLILCQPSVTYTTLVD